MTRVKRGTVAKTRRKKVLKEAKGYFGSKHRLYKTAQEQVFKSGQYAYRDRKQRKRDFRKLWITRINAACREHDITYSRFINGLNIAGIEINRKMLSEIAIDDQNSFKELVEIAKSALNGEKPVIEKKEVPVKVEKPEPKPVVTKTEEKPAVKEKSVDYNSLTVAELREIAKQNKLTGYSTMKKADLIKLIENK